MYRVRPIFIPQKAQTADDHDFNRIDEALQLISDAVNQNVQSHIERLEVDSSRLLDALETRLRRLALPMSYCTTGADCLVVQT